MAAQFWEVVGGTEKGGILVRKGRTLDSEEEEERLSTGSVVREVEAAGDRLHYERYKGSGPYSGWVSLRFKEKSLLVKIDRHEVEPVETGTHVEPFRLVGERVAVVTGANKGIGFQIAMQLKNSGLRVVVACRNEHLGRRAAANIGASFELLDLACEASIAAFAHGFEKTYGRLDVLVHNAAHIGNPAQSFKDRMGPTLGVNVHGTFMLTDSLLPLLRASAVSGGHPRIVILVSERANLSQLQASLGQQFSSQTLTQSGLLSLIRKYEEAVQAGIHESVGWGNSNYGFSKLALVAYAKVLARQEATIKINACDPGFCDTDMTRNLGVFGGRPPEEGARTPTMLALLPDDGPTGEILRDGHIVDWYSL